MENQDCSCNHGAECETGEIETVYADYVVVGAGTAGAPLIRRLANAGFSVHAIEGGADLRTDPNVLSLATTGIPHWEYEADTSPLVPIAPANPYTEGRAWGGSSSHNFFLAVRGTPALYDEWAAIVGDERLSYRSLLPLMKSLETYTPALTGFLDTSERGTDGPLFVTQGFPGEVVLTPDNPFVSAAGRVLGAPLTADYNDPNLGVFGTGNGQAYITPPPAPAVRSWSASAYLPTNVVADVDGDGVGFNGCLFIASRSVAERVLFEDELPTEIVNQATGTSQHRRDVDARHGRRAKPSLSVRGVLYRRPNGSLVQAIARKKVILAAGAIGDPGILIRSGIGPADVLESLAIEPRVVNENVGRNLQNHFGPFALLPLAAGQPPGGPVSFFGSATGLPDGPRLFQFIAQIDIPESAGGFGPFVGLIATLLRPGRTGTVVPKGRLAAAGEKIRFGFYDDPADRAYIIQLLKLVGDLSIDYTKTDISPGRLPLSPAPELYPASEYAAFGGEAPDDTALFEYTLTSSIVFNHASGTARMAACAEEGVVDANLDVFGVSGLGITSNSVVPSIPDGNTAYAAYVTGLYKAAVELGEI